MALSVLSFLGKAGRPATTPVDRQCLKENNFLLSVAGRPVRSTAPSSELSGFLGRPAGLTALSSELSGFSGRPARSTVRRFEPQIWLFIHSLSHFPLTRPTRVLPSFSPKPLQTLILPNSFKILARITLGRLDLQSQGFFTTRFSGFQI